MLLSVLQHSVKREDSRRYEVVWLQKVKVLNHLAIIFETDLLPYIMIDA